MLHKIFITELKYLILPYEVNPVKLFCDPIINSCCLFILTRFIRLGPIGRGLHFNFRPGILIPTRAGRDQTAHDHILF